MAIAIAPPKQCSNRYSECPRRHYSHYETVTRSIGTWDGVPCTCPYPHWNPKSSKEDHLLLSTPFTKKGHDPPTSVAVAKLSFEGKRKMAASSLTLGPAIASGNLIRTEPEQVSDKAIQKVVGESGECSALSQSEYFPFIVRRGGIFAAYKEGKRRKPMQDKFRISTPKLKSQSAQGRTRFRTSQSADEIFKNPLLPMVAAVVADETVVLWWICTPQNSRPEDR